MPDFNFIHVDVPTFRCSVCGRAKYAVVRVALDDREDLADLCPECIRLMSQAIEDGLPSAPETVELEATKADGPKMVVCDHYSSACKTERAHCPHLGGHEQCSCYTGNCSFVGGRVRCIPVEAPND